MKTLDQINPRDNQEVMEFVFENLLEQGEQSSNDDGDCLYRCRISPDKVLKCAAGFLIPDEQYYNGLEFVAVVENEPVGILLKDEGFDCKFVSEMQYAHDSFGDRVNDPPWPDHLLSCFTNIAEEHGLSITRLQEIHNERQAD